MAAEADRGPGTPGDWIDRDPVIEAYKRDLDRSLLRENLKLTVEERFEELRRLQEFAAELRRAGREASHDRLYRALKHFIEASCGAPTRLGRRG